MMTTCASNCARYHAACTWIRNGGASLLFVSLLLVHAAQGSEPPVFDDPSPSSSISGRGGIEHDEAPAAREFADPDSLFRNVSQPTETYPAYPVQNYNQPEWFQLSTPVTVRAFGGETYAEANSFFTFEVLKPLKSYRFASGDEQFSYLDLRGGVSAEGGGLANLGLGRRHYFSDFDTILDGNVWYDADGTTGTLFNQVTAGGQVQSQTMMLRGHYYYPFGDTSRQIGYTPLSGQYAFGGTGVQLDRSRIIHNAFQGFDTEAGVFLNLGQSRALAAIGYYNFTNDILDDLSGISVRLTVALSDGLSAGLQVTNDSETDTNALFNLTYQFYNGHRGNRPTIRHRMAEPIQRNYHIVRRETQVYDPVAATFASTGAPIQIVHASSAGGGPGDGSFENPFTDLSNAATAATGVTDGIIYAHGGSTFNGQSIVVPNEVRFLGEGQDHLIETAELGIIPLPPGSGSSVAPIIANTPGGTPAITAGAMSEINGINVQNAGGTGVLVTGIDTSALLANVSVDGAADGIRVIGNTSQEIVLQDISVTNTTGTGVYVEDNGGVNFSNALTVTSTGTDGVFVGSTQNANSVAFNGPVNISNVGGAGLRMAGNSDGSQVTFNDTLTIGGTASHGIHFDRNDDEALASFNGPVAVANTNGDGIHISNVDPGGTLLTATHLNFADTTTINNTASSGVAVNNHGGNVSFSTLQVDNWSDSAISIVDSTGDFTVVNPLALNNAGGSLAATILLSNATADTTFGDVTITDTARGGVGAASVTVLNSDTGVDWITFNSLNVTTNQGGALRVNNTGFANGRLRINGGVIDARGDTGVDLNNISTAVTFDSISVANTNDGIRLANVSQSAFGEFFRVTGDGATAGSGGTMTNVQRGIVIDRTQYTSFALMDIDSSVAGVFTSGDTFFQPEELSLTGLNLTNSTNAANWTGIDVNWGFAAHFDRMNVINNNTIAGGGANNIGLRINIDQANPQVDFTIGGNDINLAGAGSTGIRLITNGFGVVLPQNSGGIGLTAGADNTVTAATVLDTVEQNSATVEGQISVNGALVP